MKKRIYFSIIAMLLSFIWVKAEMVTTPWRGIDYSFNFCDGSIIPNNSDVKTDVDYGIIRTRIGTGTPYLYNGAQHGVEFKDGNYIEIDVAGDVTVNIYGCKYSGSTSTLTVSNKNGTYTETKLSKTAACDDILEFKYSGPKTTLVLTNAVAKTYIPRIDIISSPIISDFGETYNYNFADGSVLPQVTTTKFPIFVTDDGLVTIKSNNDNENSQFWYHDAQHGLAMFVGNSFSFVVSGNSKITIGTCQYTSVTDVEMEFTDGLGNILGSISATDKGSGACGSHSFNYKGEAGVINGVFKAPAANGTIYISSVSIENEKEKTALIDAWDFGAKELNPEIYTNWLTESFINSWYDTSVVVGSTGKTMPATFTAGVLTWVGAANKDRLRTTNENLTRYDANGSPIVIESDSLKGSLYVNSSASTARYLTINLSEDDEVTIYCKSQNPQGLINFVYSDPNIQTDTASSRSTGSKIKFVAKNTGVYKIYDTKDKPFYYRILRKDATMVKVTGTVNVTEATDIPEGYKIQFTNSAGKSWQANVSSGNYSGKVPSGFEYSLSLVNANGYIISNGSKITISEETSHEVTIRKVEMYTVSGSIIGLNASQLAKLGLVYTAPASENKIFIPETTINTTDATYTAKIEPNCAYTISATGVNDFVIPENTISIEPADLVSDISFESKPTFPATITIEGLSDVQKGKLITVFTNLNEAGYTYSFASDQEILLRDGVYSISCTGIEESPIELAMTSNLKIEGAGGSKNLVFKTVSVWPFDDATIVNGNAAYKGLLFSGNIYNEKAKSHLVGKNGASIQIPMNPGEKLTIGYYYSAKFAISGGDTIFTTSGSTSKNESISYVFTGTSSEYITLGLGAGTTYFTDIYITKILPYSEIITVGSNKEFSTINEALDAIRTMIRPNNERVSIIIDPGNYEEMLVIDIPNISFINASNAPSIAMENKGVDIDENAVRITSYYGTGYNYYSMTNNHKWNSEALRVNMENGYLSYTNTGSGTANGSYWNSTVVIDAPGFEASNIIFENSFNQYISKKESEDVVVEWAVGSKGKRPIDQGNTAVQSKSYVERAAAIAYTKNGDKSILNKCRIVGRQDSFYGAEGARVVAYKCSLMGGTDYIFGGMTLVAYKSDLAMNTSETNTDISYITAAQQTTARGYLMYECRITSAIPGTETASVYLSKPGALGRPWQGTTSEVVYFKTSIDSTNAPGFEGKSMIQAEGWNSTLGGPSEKCYEYGTIEKSGEDNSTKRASWSKVITEPVLTDGTEITTFNFTKGTDEWDPIPALEPSIPDFTAEKIVFGTVDSPSDYTCNISMDWNATHVSIILDITDDVIVNTGTNYQVDNIEVYFDMDNSKNIHWPRNGGWVSNDPTFDGNDYQFRLVPDVDFSVNNSFSGATQVYSQTSEGYKFELIIPWDSLMDGFVPEIGKLIGFDILASDNDATASDANRNQITLVSPTAFPYNDPSLFGTFQFLESGKFSIIPDETIPGIVSNLKASVDKNAVTLSWDNATDDIAILYYNVYQGSTLIKEKLYPNQTGNTLKVKDLADGDYTFSFKTVDNFGNKSASTASVSATVKTTSANYHSTEISVYPNPVLNTLTIRGIDIINKVEIIGITGNIVKSLYGFDTIDVTELLKGVYILKVNGNNKVFTSRFIKN